MRKIRQRLFCTCATALAMGTVAAILPAQAQQGFLGNVTGTFGSEGNGPSINGPQSVISLNDRETIIDWDPYDHGNSSSPIDFLPQNNSALFQNQISSQISDFTVLNRIQPTNASGVPVSRVVELNGTIQSRINGAAGGSVWFYTPGGFVVGANGVFDVGNLVLTSNPIDTTGGLYGANNTIRFRGTPGSQAGVTINSGGQITASAEGSYVALVAPRVVQGGTVSVNGSTAYVGAEQADIRINGGLFDIAITVGTTDSNGVVHTGTTSGPASVDNSPTTSDPQRIYMVAVPKNNALTMLLSGDIGYPAAATVFQENSAVVLSAGYNLVADAIQTPDSTSAANITIEGGTYSSRTSAYARGTLTIDPVAPISAPAVTFSAATTLAGGAGVVLNARPGSFITAQNDLTLSTFNINGPGSISVTAQAATGQVGTIDLLGGLTVNLFNQGVDNALVGGNVMGGTFNLSSTGGLISGQALTVDATTFSGRGANRSGDATGGAISLSASNGGTLQFTTTDLDASAVVNGDAQTAPITGGSATGGSVSFVGNGGTLDLGVVRAKAQASGGVATTGQAGNATGGNITVDLSSGTHNWTSFNGDITAASGSTTNFQGTPGSTVPGTNKILIDISGTATLNIAQSISLYAEAYSFGGGSIAGTTHGGRIDVQARDGGTLNITQDLFGTASAYVNRQSFGTQGDITNTVLGGDISVAAFGGTFNAAGLNVQAGAFAFDAGTTAGAATAGNITVASAQSNGLRGNFQLTDCENYGCNISASAAGAAGANGSSGTGGTVLLYSSDADLTVTGPLGISATGQGAASNNGFGATGSGGDGIGGTISIESRRGTLNTGTLSFGQLGASASGTPLLLGESYNYNVGNAGGGSGGTVTLSLDGGTFTADSVDLTANGFGAAADQNCLECAGGGTAAFNAGAGNGGIVTMRLNGANATIGTVALDASGTGGEAQGAFSPDSVAAIAGTARGGTASFEASSGSLTTDTFSITANGTGGAGANMFQANAADGFAGTGGTAQFTMDIGSSAAVTVRGVDTLNGLVALKVSASGTGGAGGITEVDGSGLYRAGAGGNGIGGTTNMQVAGGALTTPLIVLDARGVGGEGARNGSDGDGGAGGNGTGGAGRFTFSSEGHNIGGIGVLTSGRGGFAGDAKEIIGYDQFDLPIYAYGLGAGGKGGDGTGGRASILIDVDPTFNFLQVNADGLGTTGGNGATGGNGGAAYGGTNGNGAELAVTFGSLTVSNLEVTADATSGAGGNGATGRGGDGGLAIAGEAGLIISGGNTQVQTGIARVSSYGTSGDGGGSGITSGGGLTGGSGGAAFGGTAGILVSDNAQFTLGSSTIVAAGALGGTGRNGTPSTVPGNGGDGGSGGNTTGGTARFVVQNASLIDGADGTVQIFAGALAGVSAPGAPLGGQSGLGGNALGGIAQFEGASGTISLNTLSIEAGAFGGASYSADMGDVAGTARGGTASADFSNFVGTALPAPGTVDIAALSLDAVAYGGAGGTATGGTASTSVNGEGIVARFNSFSATASAFGGNSGSPGDPGLQGGTGGTATGGRVSFDATGNSQVTLPGSISLTADATGGAGGAGTSGATGGAGGTGGASVGGNVRFNIRSAQVQSSSFGIYTLTANGIGGNGGDGGDGSDSGATGGSGGNGGDSTGGLTVFDAISGDFALPELRLFANATGGLGGTGGIGPGSPGNPSAIPPVLPSGPIQSGIGISGAGTGGIARALNSDTGTLASGGLRSLSSLRMQANGVFPPTSFYGFAPTTGRTEIADTSTAAGGGLVIDGTVSADAFGDPSCACSGIYVSSVANPILTGDAFLSTDGPVSFTFTGSGSLRASDTLSVYSGRTITVTHTNLPTTPVNSLFSNFLYLNAQGNIGTDLSTTLRAANDLSIISQSGSVQIAELFANNSVDITATNGTVSGSSLAGGSIAVNGGQGINFATVVSGGTTDLTAANGAILLPDLSSDGLVTAIGQSVDVTGTGALSIANARATIGDLSITAGTLNVTTGFANNALTLNATGNLTAGSLSATDAMSLTSGLSTTVNGTIDPTSLTIDSGRDVSLNGPVTVTGPLRITARGTASFQGQVNAQTIAVTSGDIVIGPNAALGVRGTTTSIDLADGGIFDRSYFGGADHAGAYSLSGDEVGRLFAQNLLFSPQAQATIGGFTLIAGTTGNIGSDGSLTINSLGRMEIVGAVRLTGLGAQGGLTLRAGNGIDLFTDTGSIDLLASGQSLGGLLTVESVGFYAATRAALNDIFGINIPLDTRNDRLAINDGAVSDEGFIRAGAIVFSTPVNLFIQNSGAGTGFADRRGFTANSLSILTEGSSTEIVINGKLLGSAGAFITGIQTIPLVSINGIAGGQSSSYADRSTINGCLIGNVASCGMITVPTLDTHDTIDRVLDSTIAVGQIFPVAIVELRDFVAEGYPPLIDEPVTGAGNEDLWDSNCNVSSEQSCGDPAAQ